VRVGLPAPAAPRVPRRPSADVSYLLVNPPLTDPTSPYHSIPYLVAAARQAGFAGYRCVDANIDAFNYLAEPEFVGRLLDKAARTRADIESAGQLTRGDEIRYQAALAATGLQPDFVQRAIGIFRDPQAFHHHPTYRQAVMAVRRWFQLLSLDGLPGAFEGFGLRMLGPVNYLSHSDLADDAVIGALAAPFRPYTEGPFRVLLRERGWDVIGFSVNYITQLPVALALAREARLTSPGAVVVFGGTEVCDAVKYLRDPVAAWDLFPSADLIVPGEGETPLREILAAVRDGEPLTGIPGVMARAARDRRAQISYENVAGLPAPAYDVWDWEAYWSPEPVLLYSPSRGCYWNKCTFCDYGLNTDRPTSPSRERPAETVVADLAQMGSIGRTLYFAVDAMSPRYLRTLCTAMAEAPSRFRWAAELRLERTFPKAGMAALLARSGCVAISFGYESASQRILDLIDKGVRIVDVPAVLTDLASEGIAAQMMGFTGFPSETEQEAEETYRFLLAHRESWALAGIGQFKLTPGSIVARQPERFGIELIPAPPSCDIYRTVAWRDTATGTEHWDGDGVRAELSSAVIRSADDRPWAGGIDTAHSILYFARRGRATPWLSEDEPLVRVVGEERSAIPFANLGDFTTPQHLENQHRQMVRSGSVSHKLISDWLAAPGRARPGQSTVLILPSGTGVDLPAGADPAADGSFVRMLRLVAHTRGAA
jgi:anaerobic magnesium-protoporphyrin IX monomethyl ester cyclase